MKYRIRRTTQFKKDVRRVLKRGKDADALLSVVQELAEGHPLAEQFVEHPLKGRYVRKRDCHLGPDWILIYAIDGDELVLYRTGSHGDVFQ